MKLPLQALVFIFTLFALPTKVLAAQNPMKLAEKLHCEIAIGLEEKNQVTRILCIGNRQSESYKEIQGCVYSIIKNDRRGTPVPLTLLDPSLETNFVQINKPCSLESVESLLDMPVTAEATLGDLNENLILRFKPVVLIEKIPPLPMLRVQESTETVAMREPLERAPLDPNSRGAKHRGVPEAARSATPPATKHNTVRIFYGTNRRDMASPKGVQFTGDRATSGQLVLGLADVSIPFVHKTGELESPSIFSLELKENPDKHVVVKSVVKSTYEDFYGQMQGRVASSPQRDLFVFVHGYNVTFEDAARRTAQIAYDLRFAGAPVLFSWPSEGKIWRYNVDEANVEWSFRQLGYFLKDIVSKSGATKIHLIAHSMGNRALSNAVAWLMESQQLRQKTFQEIILAAPDVDVGLFGQISNAIQSSARKVTLYSSDSDKALSASIALHKYARLGYDKFLLPGLDTIDASKTDTSFFGLGHSYFGSRLPLLDDIKALLDSALPPDARNLIKKSAPAGLYWEFKNP